MKLFFENSNHEWEKSVKLKPTDMWVIGSSSRGRNGSTKKVYKAADGRLYYKDAGFWHGTFLSYCHGQDEGGVYTFDKDDNKVYEFDAEGNRLTEDMKLFFENKKIHETLNDELLDDNKFIEAALNSFHYFDANWSIDDFVKILEKIFSEVDQDELIKYAVQLYVNGKYDADDIIDTLLYFEETDE